jgi:hypothetical protein
MVGVFEEAANGCRFARSAEHEQQLRMPLHRPYDHPPVLIAGRAQSPVRIKYQVYGGGVAEAEFLNESPSWRGSTGTPT